MHQESVDQKQKDKIQKITAIISKKQLLKHSEANGTEQYQQLAREIANSRLRTFLFNRNQELLQLRHSHNPFYICAKFIFWKIPKWFLTSFLKSEIVKLLAFPLTIALVTPFITQQFQAQREQIATLDSYLDQLERLTFEQKLLTEQREEGAIILARGRTVAALRKLDPERKQQIIAFLSTSRLLPSDTLDIDVIMSFEDADFSNTDWRGVDLVDANFSGANFKSSNLSGANLEGVNLENSKLIEAKLSPIFKPRIKLWLPLVVPTSLKSANLQNANLAGANLTGANLTGANLTGANLTGVNLANADLTGVDLTEANLTDANLRNADLTGATLNRSVLKRTNLKNAQILDSELMDAILKNSDLRGVDLRRAKLQGAALWSSDLGGANLAGADLEGVRFTNAILTDANLAQADNFEPLEAESQGAILCPAIMPDGKKRRINC
ncbi:MAG: pentapeptide repeat-containing protein [Cyanobacteria bacterium P01_G01_bin.54]